MTTKKLTDNVKVIQLQVELDLDAPTSQSKAGVGIWRGEAVTSDGWRIFFNVYAPAKERQKPQNVKVVAK